jgi:hypothetical protein
MKSYHFVRSVLNPKALRGAGGISVFVNHKLKSKVSVLKSHDDYIVWLKVKENCVGNSKALAFCIVYFPPEGASCNSIRNYYFDVLQNDILLYKSKFDVLLMGDYNARTEDLNDFNVHVDNGGTENPFEESLEADTFPVTFCNSRISQDSGNANKYGRKLIEVCKSMNIRIVNGRLNDRPGKYTRVGTTGCSVVDYTIVDSNVANYIVSFSVDRVMPESDHCPLVLHFSPSEDKSVDACTKENTGRNIYITFNGIKIIFIN